MLSGPLIMISVSVLSRSNETMGSNSLTPCGGGLGWGVIGAVIMGLVLRFLKRTISAERPIPSPLREDRPLARSARIEIEEVGANARERMLFLLSALPSPF